jgi:hypothetical protein
MPASSALLSNPSNTPLLSVADLALELGVAENDVRTWLSDFNWERRYDARGQLCFSTQDADLLALIKSLNAVENSCTVLQTRLGGDSGESAASDDERAEESGEAEDEEAVSDLEQVASLKAELRELHGNPPEPIPFWQFWKRW